MTDVVIKIEIKLKTLVFSVLNPIIKMMIRMTTAEKGRILAKRGRSIKSDSNAPAIFPAIALMSMIRLTLLDRERSKEKCRIIKFFKLFIKNNTLFKKS